MRIKDKIKRPRRPVVAYEILPPREKDGTLNSYAANISSLLSQTHIDAINIPEVRDEVARGERPVKNQLRAEPREFGRLLQDIVGVEAIVNRVVVHQKLNEELKWPFDTGLSKGSSGHSIDGRYLLGEHPKWHTANGSRLRRCSGHRKSIIHLYSVWLFECLKEVLTLFDDLKASLSLNTLKIA